ncbi:MAG: hypothetical protein U5L07_04705 [Desulfobacterales bacterium]|nr:hypothetical protein [Desulfobacterales bacterium]
MAKDNFLSVDRTKAQYGIEAYQLFNAVRNMGLPAYSQEDLEKPLDPLQVEIDKTKVEENNKKKIGAISNPGETQSQKLMNTLTKGLLSYKYHISDCLFKETDINKKKYFKLKSSQVAAPKPLTRPELFSDERVEQAIKTAVYMAVWMERENQKREEWQGKPKWDGEKEVDFLPVLKDFRNKQKFSGSEKDIGTLIWKAIEEYYPDLRNPNYKT